jgi:hypothetical protein
MIITKKALDARHRRAHDADNAEPTTETPIIATETNN